MARLIAVAFLGLLIPHFAFAADSVPTGDSDQATVVQGNNAFAVDLYQQLKTQPGNLFFSPESISTALAMTYAGARGETALEMTKVLHFTLPPDRLHPAMGKLLTERNAAHDGYQLKESDALWAQQGYTFLADFLALTKKAYGATFNTVDFVKSDQATQTINNWVAAQTNDKITNLIAPGVLTPLTRLVLTNAIYFKGDWETQFKKADTKDENFFLAPTQAVNVPMMRRTGSFLYFDGGTFQALAIPYKGKELSMVIFLPKQVDGLAAFEQSMTPPTMQRWLDQLHHQREIILSLPVFTMATTLNLGNTLTAMGIRQAFTKEADLTGMAPLDEMRRDGNLYIGFVIHKAYVAVNEEGTEAAAATGLGAVAIGAVTLRPPAVAFRADHPFLLVIRDNTSNSILFMGRVVIPRS